MLFLLWKIPLYFLKNLYSCLQNQSVVNLCQSLYHLGSKIIAILIFHQVQRFLFASFVLQNMPTILQAGATLLLNLVNGIVNNLPQIVESVAKIIAKFVVTIGQNLPTILQQGIEIIGKLVAGLLGAIPKIIQAMPQIIASIKNAFSNVNWAEIGMNLIKGIANGITNAVGWIVDAAKAAAESAFNAAKNWLGISSPSKKGMWIGQMLDEGFALGIDNNSDDVLDAANDLVNDAFGAIAAPTANLNYPGIQGNGGQVVLNMTINGAEGQDINALAEIIQDKINNAVKSRELVYA